MTPAYLRLLFSLIVLLIPSFAFGGPLEQASINQIVNEVKVVDPQRGARRAVLKETIKDDLGVATGVNSRAELLFQDKTLTRLGAETFFSFKPGTRDLTLEKGTMLLQVPKGRGGARIRAGSVSASITGTTIMLQHLPQQRIKVLVLEGSLRLAFNNRPSEAIVLTPGRLVTMEPKAKRLPEPVSVDLRKFVKTSSLVDPRGFQGGSETSSAPLPSMGLIKKEIAHQDSQHPDRQPTVSKHLISTSLANSSAKAQQIAQSTQSTTAIQQSTSTDSNEKRATVEGGTPQEQKKAAEAQKKADKKAAAAQKKAGKKDAEAQKKAEKKAEPKKK